MTGLPRLIATPELATGVLSVAMVTMLAVAIVVLSGPGASPAPAVTQAPAPSSSDEAPSVEPSSTSPRAELRGLVAANDAVLTDATALQEAFDGGGTGARLVIGLRRLNVSIGVATEAARAIPIGSPGGTIAGELATLYPMIRQRIADGLAVSVTDTVAYRATASDVLAQLAVIRVRDAQLRALGGG